MQTSNDKERATMPEWNAPGYLHAKVYGQTRTLVDMLAALNKEHQYTSPEDAVADLYRHIHNIRTDGDSIAQSCCRAMLRDLLWESFSDGALDIERLKQRLEETKNEQPLQKSVDEVYRNYVIEKSLVLVAHLNAFRRYTKPEDVVSDFVRAIKVKDFNGRDYYSFGSPVSEHSNVVYRLETDIISYWSQMTKDGVLDNKALFDVMIGQHEKALREEGLETMIANHYRFGPCYPERCAAVNFVGPSYTADYSKDGHLRRYIKSCGEEGMGGHEFRWELEHIRPLLMEDPKYITIGEGYEEIFLPKEDFSLPIYNDKGLMRFETQEAKEQYILHRLPKRKLKSHN